MYVLAIDKKYKDTVSNAWLIFNLCIVHFKFTFVIFKFCCIQMSWDVKSINLLYTFKLICSIGNRQGGIFIVLCNYYTYQLRLNVSNKTFYQQVTFTRVNETLVLWIAYFCTQSRIRLYSSFALFKAFALAGTNLKRFWAVITVPWFPAHFWPDIILPSA